MKPTIWKLVLKLSGPVGEITETYFTDNVAAVGAAQRTLAVVGAQVNYGLFDIVGFSVERVETTVLPPVALEPRFGRSLSRE